MTYNAADPSSVKERGEKAKGRVDQQRADLKELLELPAFRRFLWRHICETCNAVGKSAFSTNGSVQSHNLGMQSVGVALWSEIEAIDATIIPRMMTEYQESLK